MNYDDFEKELIGLLTSDRLEDAEDRKAAAIPWLESALVDDPETAKKILTLFSELAGEAVSFDNFSKLLDDLMANKL